MQSLMRDCPNPGTAAGAVFYAVVCVGAAWLAGRAVRLAVHRTLDYHVPSADPTVVTFLGRLARLAIYIIAFLTYAHLIPVLNKLGTVWLTSVGVVSVVLGLAAQSTLANLIAGVALLLYRPFRIGDRLQVTAPTGLESGVVEELGLGYTTLLTDDNRRIVIPNSVMASQTSINAPRAEQRATSVVAVNIGYSADIDKARTVLTELAKAHAKAMEVASCKVTALTDLGVTMTLTVWCADAGTAADVKCDLLEAVKKRFDAEGIAIAHH